MTVSVADQREEPPPAAEERPPAQLTGTLGVGSIVFMVAAAASPLGVIGGPAPLGISLGNGVGFPAAFVVAGVVLLLFSVGFTAMTPHVRAPGAFSAYVGEGLGRRFGLGAGFAALLSYTTLLAGVYGLLGPGVDSLLAAYGAPHLPWYAYAGIALALVSLLGYRNINLSSRVLAVGLVAEVLIVLALDSAVILHSGGEGLSTGLVDPRSVVSGSAGVGLLFALLSYIGFEATAVFRGEARDPDRTIPRATYTALLSITVFYTVSSWALISAFGDDGAVAEATNRGGDMLADAAEKHLGAAGAHIVQLLFVTSIFACVLAVHNIVSRYVFTLSGSGALPAGLVAVHAGHRSPHRASVAVSAVVAIALAAAAATRVDAVREYYTWLAGFSSVGVVLLYALTSLSVIVYFVRNPQPQLPKWRTATAPSLALAGLLALLVPILVNLPVLVGGSAALALLIVAAIIAVFALGVALDRRSEIGHAATEAAGQGQ